MGKQFCFLILFLILTNSFIKGVYSSATFTLVNKCQFTIWPGILSSAGIDPLPTTGFALQTGESRILSAPSSWGGRFWARTHCTQDTTGKFSCLTGDCDSGTIECAGKGATPPATLAEFKLDGDAGKDFYDVSLVDGYNLPILVVPQGGTGDQCTKTGCVRDLNGVCPSELRVTSDEGEGVACKSACEAFKSDEYCCTGSYGTPDSCRPSQYSKVFKSTCPQAYSYAYDDTTSTFTCIDSDYTITFCPSPNTSQKSSSLGDQNQSPGSDSPSFDSNMVYQGALDVNTATTTTTCRNALGAAVVVTTALWRLFHLI